LKILVFFRTKPLGSTSLFNEADVLFNILDRARGRTPETGSAVQE
jgi:hypothetical protein